MSSKILANDGIELIFTKEGSEFIVYARKDGETRHFCEDTDLPSVKATVMTEVMKGIDWNGIQSY